MSKFLSDHRVVARPRIGRAGWALVLAVLAAVTFIWAVRAWPTGIDVVINESGRADVYVTDSNLSRIDIVAMPLCALLIALLLRQIVPPRHIGAGVVLATINVIALLVLGSAVSDTAWWFSLPAGQTVAWGVATFTAIFYMFVFSLPWFGHLVNS